ncbi:MAG: hypothetical protein IT519_00425 [Burkholderiales bacterium]|jgi:hypothetical protein|nr:hypothetical protein [Burkholderiales bacterium]
MVGEAARLIVLVAACAMSGPLGAEAFEVRGGCRDARPHGIYELSTADGRVRVLGAFNLGQRTSSFLFWSPGGVRIAQIPWDDGTISGTVALWYSDAPRGGDPPWKLQASFARGVPDGPTRSWYRNGRLSGEYFYDRGALVAAKAWTASGAPVSEERARAQAVKAAGENLRAFAALGAIVDANLPRCEGDPGRTPQ